MTVGPTGRGPVTLGRLTVGASCPLAQPRPARCLPARCFPARPYPLAAPYPLTAPHLLAAWPQTAAPRYLASPLRRATASRSGRGTAGRAGRGPLGPSVHPVQRPVRRASSRWPAPPQDAGTRPPPATILLAATVSSATHAKRDREYPGTDSAAATGPRFTPLRGHPVSRARWRGIPARRKKEGDYRGHGAGARGGEGGERRSAPVCSVECRRCPRPDRRRTATGRALRYRHGRRRPGHERTAE